MKKWLRKLAAQLKVSRGDIVLLNLSFHRQTAKQADAFVLTAPEPPKIEDHSKKSVGAFVPAQPSTCPACGGALETDVLSYWCDPTTDVISAADISETCISCRRSLTRELPRPGY